MGSLTRGPDATRIPFLYDPLYLKCRAGAICPKSKAKRDDELTEAERNSMSGRDLNGGADLTFAIVGYDPLFMQLPGDIKVRKSE
jgi:hypothetical protein